jgi:hypothetical protein
MLERTKHVPNHESRAYQKYYATNDNKNKSFSFKQKVVMKQRQKQKIKKTTTNLDKTK